MATTKKISTKKSTKKVENIEANVINLGESKQPVWYPVDFDKVKTIEDVKLILENMGLGCYDNAPAYDKLKKFLFTSYIKVVK